MFIYICQTTLNLQKTLNNWNSEKIYLAVCGRVLVVCGLFLVVCHRLLVVYGCLLVVCGRLLVVRDRLWWFVVICGCFWSLPVLVTTILPELHKKNLKVFRTYHEGL